MKQIVQCVPNFSEGRDLDKIEKIVSVLDDEGYKLISYEPDGDYNRTVVTLLGEPKAIIKGLLKMTSQCIDLIDMNNQSGQHPRMGAIDVIPFISISNITMEECVTYSNQCAKEINELYNIPIFMYAEAANKKDRVRLPNIRKGEFEGMKDKIKDPNWSPDYGINEIHPTFGVIGVGARKPLIAYNIDLDTEDEEIASKLARWIRGSSGGYKFIQAGPAYLESRGHMQVTMNILDL